VSRLTAVLLLAGAVAHAQEVFRYPVFRLKAARDEPGQLQVDQSGVSYRSDRGKTSIRIPLADVHQADVSDPRFIRIETYDILKRRLAGRRVHSFRLRDGQHDAALARFLASRLARPVVGTFSAETRESFQLAAYHRHRLGGCPGQLRLDGDGIRFLSPRAGESRTWLYRDIDTIGTMNRFHFRVTTLAETYNLDLKERLPEEAYNEAWRLVYRPAGR